MRRARISRRTHASHPPWIRAARPSLACLARRSRHRPDRRLCGDRSRQQRGAGRSAQGRRRQHRDDRRAADARPDGVHRRPGRHDHAARVRAAVHLRCQLERGADAGREPAGDLERRPGLHDPAEEGRQVPQRPRDDLGRRARFAQALDGHGAARQGGRQGNQEPRGQGAEHHRHHAQPALCAAARAPGAAQRLCRDHGQGLDRHAADPVRRHRPVHVQGEEARPVRSAGALRRLQRPQRAGERLRRQARSLARRAALHSRAQRQHARRRVALGAVPLRRSVAGRVVCAARERGQRQAGPDRAVRLSVPGAQYQAGAAHQRRAAPGGAGRA